MRRPAVGQARDHIVGEVDAGEHAAEVTAW